MELEIGRRPWIPMIVSRLLAGISTMTKKPPTPEDTCMEWSTDLKQFYKSEGLKEPEEIAEAFEKIETYSEINSRVRLD